MMKEILKNAKVVVTGGAGFIGSNLCRELIEQGVLKVTVLDNLSTGFASNFADLIDNAHFQFIKGDICNTDECDAAIEGAQYIFHLAALGSVTRSIENPLNTAQSNIIGFLNVLQSAKNFGVKRIIYAGSSSTYGDDPSPVKLEERIGKPLSPYAVTKYADELFAETFAKVYGMQLVGLRFFNVFGPYQNPKGAYAAVIPIFMQCLLQHKKPIINGDGEQSRDFTFIANVVNAMLKAMFDYSDLNGHEVFNVACGETTSLNSLWKMICALEGESIEAEHGPNRVGDIRNSLADIHKAKQKFGYEPSYSVEDGLKKTYDWYKNEFTKN